MQSALKCRCIQNFVEPLVELAHKFSRSRVLWTAFKKVSWKCCIGRASSNNEGDADFDEDKELSCNVLRLLTPVFTR